MHIDKEFVDAQGGRASFCIRTLRFHKISHCCHHDDHQTTVERAISQLYSSIQNKRGNSAGIGRRFALAPAIFPLRRLLNQFNEPRGQSYGPPDLDVTLQPFECTFIQFVRRYYSILLLNINPSSTIWLLTLCFLSVISLHTHSCETHISLQLYAYIKFRHN